MSTLIDTYIAGGVGNMHLLTLLLMFNLVVIGYVVFSHLKKNSVNEKWIEAVKHVANFAVAFGTFGTLVGLFFAFDALEASKEIIPFQVIMGGLKVGLINILYGLIIYFISMLAYVAMKLKVQATRIQL